MGEPCIEIRGVTKRFGRVQSLDGLSFTVETGAVFGFLGPNGAGKTTTLRALLGLVRPDDGTLRVVGLDPARAGGAVRERVGVLLETDGLYDRLSAHHNLDYHARIRHLPAATRRARIEELLRSFELWDRRFDKVITWSKGMRQKLAIARALLHRPPLLLLDEPFTGLDPAAAADLRERIVRLAKEERVTVLLTTHDLAHVEKACSDLAVIKRGRVIAEGTPEALRGSATSGPELELVVAGAGLTATVLETLRADGLLVSFVVEGDAARGDGQPRARVRCLRERRARLGVELCARGVLLSELTPVRSSLEDAFLLLTRPGGDAGAGEDAR